MSKKLTELVIDRSKWGRGNTGGAMLNSKTTANSKEAVGKMCCLGFLGKQCGFSDKKMRGQMTPTDVLSSYSQKKQDKFLTIPMLKALMDISDSCDGTYGALMNVNDDISLTDSERQKTLKKLFREIGIKATFVN